MTAAPLLDVSGLGVELVGRRGRFVAVDEVSFALARGEVLGVVGESGAGKSLLGAAILGLLDPPARIVAGAIRLDGERIDILPRAAWRTIRGRRIGAIFQDPLAALDPLYTIGAQIEETILAHLPLSAQQARARAIALLGEVGIAMPGRRIDDYPHQLSGGMRQRVVIALALAAEPRLVIADEPTTALDLSLQSQIIGLLLRLCREHGIAVLLITHDMGLIAETATRVAVMYAGRIVETGPVEAVLREPQHPYTIALMNSVPRIGDHREKLAHIEGAMPRPDAIPRGCAFNPRCPRALDLCRRERPVLMSSGQTQSACWLHTDAR
jgi:peptide/nickel transport system ATP-binding protein